MRVSKLERMANSLKKSAKNARKPAAEPLVKPVAETAANYSAATGAATRHAIPEECAGLRLDQALAKLFPQYSRSRLQAWLKDGTLRVGEGGSVPSPSRAVMGGEAVSLVPDAQAVETVAPAQALPLEIVFEDADLIVIDKPAGLVVHPGAGNPDHTLMNALLAHAPELAAVPRAGIVHRLDKDTSGLLVVARTLEAQASLVRQLQSRSMGRTYQALVWGRPRTLRGIVDAPIGRDPRSRVRMAINERGKPARTAWEVVEQLPAASLLSCTLESGRTHQIRVHLQSIGLPLVGDPVYRVGAKTARTGTEALGSFKRQALHAAKLALDHPRSGKAMQWTSPLPADFRALLRRMRSAGREAA